MSNLSTDDQFLYSFKSQTEERWSKTKFNPKIYGFQFLRGTKWNPGLTDTQIAEYERVLGTRFPDDFRRFLRVMNGTDLPTVNIYGYSGEPHRTSIGVYSYPRDLEIVKSRLDDIRGIRNEIAQVLSEQSFVLEIETGLVPIYVHRYIVCTSDPTQSTVLSIYGTDAIIYGETLREYLEKEFL